MEEITRSKSTKPSSAFRNRFQAHGTIARSLGPFCLHAARLDSSDPTAGRSLLAISACMCSSSTAEVIDAQVPARRRSSAAAEDVKQTNQPAMAMPKKSRLSTSFTKGYAKVSDVSSASRRNGNAAALSPKSGNRAVNSRRRMDGSHSQKPALYQSSCMNANSPKAGHSKGCCRSTIDHAYLGRCRSRRTHMDWNDHGSCHRKSSESAHLQQGHLCKKAGGCLPVVEYTWDPCRAFYESMMEMVTLRCVHLHDDDLEDMFACYLVLNSSHHHADIEKAFTILLTQLYKSKLLTIEGDDSCAEPVILHRP